MIQNKCVCIYVYKLKFFPHNSFNRQDQSLWREGKNLKPDTEWSTEVVNELIMSKRFRNVSPIKMRSRCQETHQKTTQQTNQLLHHSLAMQCVLKYPAWRNPLAQVRPIKMDNKWKNLDGHELSTQFPCFASNIPQHVIHTRFSPSSPAMAEKICWWSSRVWAQWLRWSSHVFLARPAPPPFQDSKTLWFLFSWKWSGK